MVPLKVGVGDQRGVFAPRPRTAHAPRRAASGPPTPGLGQSRRARSASWAPGGGPWDWSLGELEARVQCRLGESLGSVRATLRQLDLQGTGQVGLQDFIRFLGSLLGLGPRQLTPLVHQVCGRNGVAVDYMRFLRTYGRASPGLRATDRWSPERRPMPLSEIQRLLRNKMAGSSLARVFRALDPRGEGRVRRQDLRRVLEECCPSLTDLEFQRLWDHCSPDSTTHMSYKDLLHKLEDSTSPETQDLDLGPVCTRMELSSPGAVTQDRVRMKMGSRARKIRSGDPQDPQDPTRGLTNTQRQSLFHQEMCLHRVPVWQTLQAADVTGSGLVQQEVLRNVLCNFLFPMSPHSFHELTRGYGVKGAGPVKWKHFLGHFVDPAERPEDPPPSADGALHQLLPKESPPDLEEEEEEELSSRLKEIFHLLDPSGSGRVVRAELRLALEAPYLHLGGCGGGPPDRPHPRGPRLRLSRARVSELLNRLDPGHTGLVHRDRLEAVLLPGRGSTPPSPPCTEGPAPLPGEGGEGQVQENLAGLLGSGLAALRLSDPEGSWAGPRDDLMTATPIAHPDQGTPLDHIGPDLSGPDHSGPDINEKDHSGPDLSRPDQSGPDHIGPDQSGLGNTGPDHRGPDHIGADHSGPDHSGPNQSVPELSGPDHSGPDHNGPELSGPDHSGPDHNGPDHSRPDHSRPDHSGPDHNGPDHSRPDHSRPDHIRPDHSRPDHSRPDHSGPDHSGPHSPLRSPSSPSGGAGARGVLQIVFRRVRESLERRGATLAERIQATTHPRPDGTLSERDLRKVLEDSWVVLEDGHFQHVAALLGFRQGRLARSRLLDQYGEFSSRAEKQQGPGHHGDEPDKPRLLSAEECLAAMRAKMADGRALRTADGDGGDLREAFRRLGLAASEPEFQRLLRLIGPLPGAELPKPRPHRSVHLGGAREKTRDALDLIQEQLASDLRFKWTFMLQALCSPPEDDQELVFKKSLRNHLFTYDLPLRPDEFEQLWHRFDPEGRGCVALVDFLDKLGVKHDGKSSVRGPQAEEDARSDVVKAEVLEMNVPMDGGRRKLARQDFLSASRPQEEEVTGSAPPTPRPANPVESLHPGLSRLQELAPVLRKNVQAPARETDSPPITELLGRIQGAVSRHLFDITKAMVAMESSGTRGISREDLRRVCARYLLLTPRQFERVWAELPVSASGRLRCGEFLQRFGAADPRGLAGIPACTSPALRERASSTMSHARRPKTAAAAPLRPQSAPQCPPRVWSATGGSRRGGPPGNRKWRRDVHTSPASFRDSSVRRESASVTHTGPASRPDPVRRFLLDLRPQEVSGPFQRNRLPPPTKTTGPGVLTAQCVEVLLGVRRAVRSSWRPIRHAFVTYDPGRTGRISARDFRKVLRGFGVSLTEEDFFQLSCYLDAGALGTVGYNDFLRAYLR